MNGSKKYDEIIESMTNNEYYFKALVRCTEFGGDLKIAIEFINILKIDKLLNYLIEKQLKILSTE